MGLSKVRAHAVAVRLDVGLDGVCLACLSIVSMAIDVGEEADVARQVRRMTPELWSDGLEETALASVRRALERGVTDADEALADLEANGSRSATARAIVRKLALDLSRQVHTSDRIGSLALERFQRGQAEWN